MTVNLSHVHFRGLEGVYIIWHGGQNPRVVYVGQGAIADRLAAHREELTNTQYSSLGLFVTWAYVDPAYRDGVERTGAVGERVSDTVADDRGWWKSDDHIGCHARGLRRR